MKHRPFNVMAGLVPAIPITFAPSCHLNRDARHKAGMTNESPCKKRRANKNHAPGHSPHRQGRAHGLRRCGLRCRRPVEGARRRMGQDAGLGEPARHRLARHHPHPALPRPDQGEVDQSRAEHPGRAQARLGRGGARSRPRAVGGRADARRGRGRHGRPRCRRRLVCGAPPHAHWRNRLFRLAGRGGGLRRHRHERVRPDDDLSGVAGRGGVVQPDRIRHSPQGRRALSAGLLDRRRCQRQDHGRGRSRRGYSHRLGRRQGRSRYHRSEKRSRTCCRWRASRARACRS